jgi:hypothetical protein
VGGAGIKVGVGVSASLRIGVTVGVKVGAGGTAMVGRLSIRTTVGVKVAGATGVGDDTPTRHAKIKITTRDRVM